MQPSAACPQRLWSDVATSGAPQIYSSDEGRVQMSAAAFTQGLLDLEGTSLTPILVRSA